MAAKLDDDRYGISSESFRLNFSTIKKDLKSEIRFIHTKQSSELLYFTG